MTAPVHNVAIPSQKRVKGAILTNVERRYPDQFPRRVLLAVAGMSPQIITETLYALGHAPRPFLPTEVYVVTTASGRQRILLELLGEEHGWFSRLYTDYPGMPAPRFHAGHVRVIAGPSGDLDDIRGEEENAMAADVIAEGIREFSTDPDCALHVSMAGGRKTMGYFAGAALSLYGRPQDRLSHVLVSEAFEAHPQFFYPSPRQRVIYHTRDSRPLDAHEARVTLADIPFVRLRGLLRPEQLAHSAPFREAIAAARLAVEPPQMEIHLAKRLVRIGGIERKAPPAELAYFLWIWGRQQSRLDPTYGPTGPEPDYAREYERLYVELNDLSAPDSRTRSTLREGMDGDYFRQRRSRWNRFLRDAFGNIANPFHVEAEGKRGSTTYRVPAIPSQVVLETPAEETSK